MILDGQHLFSNAQALTSTAASTNIIDLGSDRNIGVGEEMAVVLQLTVAADDADGNETYSAAIQTDDNSSFSSAATLGTLTITRGDAAGTRYVFMLPKDSSVEQYLRVNYTLGGTSPSVTLDAFLIPAKGLEHVDYYSSGYTVS